MVLAMCHGPWRLFAWRKACRRGTPTAKRFWTPSGQFTNPPRALPNVLLRHVNRPRHAPKDEAKELDSIRGHNPAGLGGSFAEPAWLLHGWSGSVENRGSNPRSPDRPPASERVGWLVESDGPARLECRVAVDRHPVYQWSSYEPAKARRSRRKAAAESPPTAGEPIQGTVAV